MAVCPERIPGPDEERVNRALVGVTSGNWGNFDWYEQAECRSRSTRLWFSNYRRTIDGAIAVCRRCAVSSACLALAMDHPELVGVWGGTDEEERARIRREMRHQSR